MLGHGKAAITGQERGDLLALAGRMGTEGDAIAALSSPARGSARPGRSKSVRDTTVPGHGGAPADRAG